MAHIQNKWIVYHFILQTPGVFFILMVNVTITKCVMRWFIDWLWPRWHSFCLSKQQSTDQPTNQKSLKTEMERIINQNIWIQTTDWWNGIALTETNGPILQTNNPQKWSNKNLNGSFFYDVFLLNKAWHAENILSKFLWHRHCYKYLI